MNTRETGRIYEKLAAKYLAASGYEILEHNFYCRFGEIDLVAREDGCLVFVEVKYRKSGEWGEASLAVDKKKQRKLSRSAACYLQTRGVSGRVSCRFDVVAVTGNEVKLYRNAFDFVR